MQPWMTLSVHQLPCPSLRSCPTMEYAAASAFPHASLSQQPDAARRGRASQPGECARTRPAMSCSVRTAGLLRPALPCYSPVRGCYNRRLVLLRRITGVDFFATTMLTFATSGISFCYYDPPASAVRGRRRCSDEQCPAISTAHDATTGVATCYNQRLLLLQRIAGVDFLLQPRQLLLQPAFSFATTHHRHLFFCYNYVVFCYNCVAICYYDPPATEKKLRPATCFCSDRRRFLLQLAELFAGTVVVARFCAGPARLHQRRRGELQWRVLQPTTARATNDMGVMRRS